MTLTWIAWQRFLTIGRSPAWDGGRQRDKPVCWAGKTKRAAFPWCPVSIRDWILQPPAAAAGCQHRGAVPGTPQPQVPGACLWGALFAGLPANTGKAESAHDPLCFKRANNLSKGWKPFIFLFFPLLSHLLFLFPCCFFRFRPFVSSLLDICPLPGLLLRAAKGHRHHLPYSTLW